MYFTNVVAFPICDQFWTVYNGHHMRLASALALHNEQSPLHTREQLSRPMVVMIPTKLMQTLYPQEQAA